MSKFMQVEDLTVYQKLCHLHIDICDLTHKWPAEERYELGAQVRKASNGAPANLAEKNSDRHVRNTIEGINRARGEALETVHHLYIARLKAYVPQAVFESFRGRYAECVRMMNGMEKTLEKELPEPEQRWPSSRPPSTPGSEL